MQLRMGFHPCPPRLPLQHLSTCKQQGPEAAERGPFVLQALRGLAQLPRGAEPSFPLAYNCPDGHGGCWKRAAPQSG